MVSIKNEDCTIEGQGHESAIENQTMGVARRKGNQTTSGRYKAFFPKAFTLKNKARRLNGKCRDLTLCGMSM